MAKTVALSVIAVLTFGYAHSSDSGGDFDPIQATVNGWPIRLSSVYQHIEALPIGDQIDVRDQLDRFTESVIQEEVLFQYALHHFLNDELSIRDAFKTSLLGHLLENQVDSRVNVSDSHVKNYYEDHQSELRGEHWRIHQIPLQSDAQCEELLVRATSLDRFTELARNHSVDGTLADRGGDMGYVMRYHNVLGMGDQLFRLSLNMAHQISNEDGCHLLWISEHISPPLPPLDAVKDQIRQVLERQQKVTLLTALLDKAAKDVEVDRRLSQRNLTETLVANPIE